MAEIMLGEDKFETMLDWAAERGAKRALERVGLHDEKAGRDIYDLRELIEGWREVKKGALRSLGKILVAAILILLAFTAGKHAPWGR